MKQGPAAKTNRKSADERSQDVSGSGRAVALAPPPYGIDFVDRPASAPVQRLVVNTGDASFTKELSKKNGWIVGSDMDLAFYEGGYGQEVAEFDALEGHAKVGKDENIYLEGHGSAGKLGAKDPSEVAKALNGVLPKGYGGAIRSHSCSAGVVGDQGKSGVQMLAELLKQSGLTVEGAGGVALNHIVYYNGTTKGTRAFTEGTQGEKAIEKAISSTEGPVNQAWRSYVQTEGISADKYPEAAKMATKVSADFYEKLEASVETFLLPREESLTTGTSPSGGCFITTACVRARGLPDDCIELTTLRAFRDRYIAPMKNGMKMLKVYYRNSPFIVEEIERRPDALEIYDGLYGVICECVRQIQEESHASAFQTYVEMVIELRNRFAPAAEIPSFFHT